MNVKLRPVNPEKDAGRLAEIYNPYITQTAVSYEQDEIDADEFVRRIRSSVDRYPYIVLEIDGVVQGYAYASTFNTRKSYDWDVDLSIYLDMNLRGKGYGTMLMSALLEILTDMGYINAYSLINIPNDASEALHRKFGFKKTGEYNHTGWKFGRWLDMGIYSKCLSDVEVPAEINTNWRGHSLLQ